MERINQTQHSLSFTEFLDIRLKTFAEVWKAKDVKAIAKIDDMTSFVIGSMMCRTPLEYTYNEKSGLVMAKTEHDFRTFKAL